MLTSIFSKTNVKELMLIMVLIKTDVDPNYKLNPKVVILIRFNLSHTQTLCSKPYVSVERPFPSLPLPCSWKLWLLSSSLVMTTSVCARDYRLELWVPIVGVGTELPSPLVLGSLLLFIIIISWMLFPCSLFCVSWE